eukprot:199200_1
MRFNSTIATMLTVYVILYVTTTNSYSFIITEFETEEDTSYTSARVDQWSREREGYWMSNMKSFFSDAKHDDRRYLFGYSRPLDSNYIWSQWSTFTTANKQRMGRKCHLRNIWIQGVKKFAHSKFTQMKFTKFTKLHLL